MGSATAFFEDAGPTSYEPGSGQDGSNPQRLERALSKQHPRVRFSYQAHPLRVYRPGRLARLLDVNPSTIWRWEKDGVLPRAIEYGGVRGWTETTLAKWFEEREQEAGHAR